jgi:carbamoyltransferase
MKLGHILGISAGFHDAAATVIRSDGEIVFAGHSERYSKQKNDANIDIGLIREVVGYSLDHVAYYERPWVKQLRNLRTGQGIDWTSITAGQVLKQQLPGMKYIPKISTHNHHLSHAAAGFQTSPYDRATVVVIDAIGEFDTISIWGAEYDSKGHAVYKRLWGQQYPHSIGLFYSAVTKRVGLHPLDE